MIKSLSVLFVLPALLLASTASAQDNAEFLTRQDSWTAHAKTEGGRKVCYMWSKPTKAQGNYTARGEVVAFVTIYKPAPKGEEFFDGGQVSVVAGYNYQKDSAVEADIDSKKFTLYTQGDTAWAADAETDKSLIEAMKAGVAMTVKGNSWRPTETVDRYSLKGFTATYNAIRKACR